jgi:hypothetical protein
MRLRRTLLPVLVFGVVWTAHFVWLGLFPERDPTQDRWAAVPHTERTWFQNYVETQSYWMGFSYTLALAFAATALRRYREDRFCGARNIAIGGITLTGFLGVAGCFLLGCCGSPMLIVYLNLFGAWFLPLAKPIVAALTTLSVIGGWIWTKRRAKSIRPGTPNCIPFS